MKKLFRMAMMAAMALPLMMACTPKNPADDPSKKENQAGTEEWFEKWTEGEKKDQLTIKEENLYGLWSLMAFATTHPDSVAPLGGYDYSKGTNDMGYYLELRKDSTFTYYDYDKALIKYEGKWKLTGGNRITFIAPLSNSWGCAEGEHNVELLEADRLVLSYLDPNQGGIQNLRNWRIYRRIDKLPELPPTGEEKLTANMWRVVSDSLYIRKADGTKEVLQDDLLPKGAIISFSKLGTVEVVDANKNLIGHAQWEIRQDLGNYLLVDITNGEGIVEDEPRLIPGLINHFMFSFGQEDPNKPEIEHVGSEQEPKVWIYHLEAVK